MDQVSPSLSHLLLTLPHFNPIWNGGEKKKKKFFLSRLLAWMDVIGEKEEEEEEEEIRRDAEISIKPPRT